MRSSRRFAAVALAITAALAGAGCSDVSGPVDVYVVTYVPAVREFRLEPRRVETIESVAEGRGGTTKILKEPVARVSGDSIVLEGGVAPNILFSERGGAVVPQDWDSLILLSYYQHLEASVAYFGSLGLDTEPMVPLPTYYRMSLGIDPALIGLVDNAAYFPEGHAFLLFESFFIDEIPLAMNDAVVTHELAHAAFHRIMNGDEREPIEYRENWPDEAINHMGAVHEGQSDIYAAMHLDEPDFFRFSFPGSIAEDRDMTVERILSPTHVADLGRGEAEVHEIGAVIAAAVWAISDTIGRQRAAEMTIAAERTLTASDLDPGFRLTDFLGRFAGAGNPAEKAESCAVFCDRFALVKEEIATCACP